MKTETNKTFKDYIKNAIFVCNKKNLGTQNKKFDLQIFKSLHVKKI